MNENTTQIYLQEITDEEIKGYSVTEALFRLRNQQPFLPIIPFPNSAKTAVFTTAAGENLTIDLPESTKLICFSYSKALDIAVNINGNPTALDDLLTPQVVEGGDIVNPPEGVFYFVENVRSVSVRNLNNAVGFVTVQAYIQQG